LKLINKIKEHILLIILFFLIVINVVLIVGIVFHLGSILPSFARPIVDIYHEKLFQFSDTIVSLGALIGFVILHLRNKEMSKQTKAQYDIFTKNNHFDNFHRATKMLTDKGSTIEAKISALFLLYDVAEAHQEDLDRIIQVINKQLTPLLNCIENNCNTKPYTKRLVSIEYKFYPHRKKETFKFKKNDIVNIDIYDDNAFKTIKEWQHKGNDTEKLISVSLYVLKKIVLKIAQNKNDHIDLSNTIIFNIDTDFDKNLKFESKRPIENLIFLNCKLEGVDFNNVIYHQASFINCDLTNSKFNNANLWGTLFANCNLKGVKFDDAQCDIVEFKKFKNLTFEQIERMKFKNEKEKDGLTIYPLIISSKDIRNIEGLSEEQCYRTVDELNQAIYGKHND